MYDRRLAPCSLLSAAALLACDPGTSTLAWSVELSAGVPEESIALVEATIHRGGCDARDDAALYRAERRRGEDEAPMAPDALEPGTYAFSARARDASCAWIATGCVELTLPAPDGERVIVPLAAADPEPACGREACWAGVCVDREEVGAPCGDGAIAELACRPDGAGRMVDVCRRSAPPIFDGDPGELAAATAVRIARDDLSATFRMEWDCDALYVGAIVTDPSLFAVVEDPTRSRDHPDLYTTDSVEVLLDVSATFSDLPDADDRHAIVNIDGRVWDAAGAGSPWDADAVDMADLRRELILVGTVGDALPDEGWAIEIAIPWSELGVSACPEAGRVMGLDLAVNDQRDVDGTPALHKTIDWAGLAIYANPDQWNCLRLIDEPAGD